MSKRLQVLIPDPEMADIQRLATREHLTVGEWVRRALREARARQPVNEAEVKIKAVRKAVEHSFPSGDIGPMLDEIQRGYLA
ncbi:MAG: ribbon-helix-helix protein, CopG family [Acidobacteriota bacterium]|nr:ribbon-helix-helix protein, CopG family [Acidobacteriota bacterium]